jgi:hypothetical protein
MKVLSPKTLKRACLVGLSIGSCVTYNMTVPTTGIEPMEAKFRAWLPCQQSTWDHPCHDFRPQGLLHSSS